VLITTVLSVPYCAGRFRRHQIGARTGKEKPDQAFVAVPCDGLWFWIGRRDFASKSVLATVTLLFKFLGNENSTAPVLTIPTN
jgi:hypothetical protein